MAGNKYQLIGDEKAPFADYNSCTDKTRTAPNHLIRGSFNMYKKRSGNIANRCGLKRIGDVDPTEAGIKSSYEYKSSFGKTLPLRVVGETVDTSGVGNGDAKLQVKFEDAWYNLLTATSLVNPALTKSRFSFSTWFDGDLSNALSEFKSILVMVRGGEKEILHWSGGITKVASTQLVVGGIQLSSLGSGGTGYVVGDELTVTGGNGDARIVVTKVTAGVITSTTPGGYYLKKRGSNYTAGTLPTTGGSGSGATFVVTVSDYYRVTKTDSSESWKEAGFTSYPNLFANSTGYMKIIINGTEFIHVGDMDTDTIDILIGNGATIAAGQTVIQSVFVETATELSDGFLCDFIVTLENQLCVGSYTSRLIHISCSSTVGAELGFLNFLAISNDLVIGDPDFAILDDVSNGMIASKGCLLVSSGTSDWWKITPNFTPPIQIPQYNGLTGSTLAYVITKKEKFTGTGLSGLYAHEFIDSVGDNIYYLSKDQQMRVIGSVSQLEGTQFPIVSKNVFEELQEENFEGGHMKADSDIIYLTAPTTGRHWMYQITGDLDVVGQITGQRTWHPPQMSGISRFASIEGILHGHSNAHPVLYQVWDTGQWYDDSATDVSGQLAYNCVMRMAYRNHGDRASLKSFTDVLYEGYIQYGTPLYGNIYFEYQGNFGEVSININSDDEPAKLYSGSGFISVGGAPLGLNPLGLGPLVERVDQELLPKFRAVKRAGPKPVDCLEYCLEVLSNTQGARWEIICLGPNVVESGQLPTYLKK